MTFNQRPARPVYGSSSGLLVTCLLKAASALAVLPASLAAIPAAQQIYPVAYPIDRYVELMDQSPFALATPAAAPPPPERLFCEGWKLKAVSFLPNEHGVPTSFVVVKTADARDSIAFWGNESVHGGAGDGASVTAINPSPETGKTTVMIKKGAEVGKIEADQMDVAGAPLTPRSPPPHTLGHPGSAIPPGRSAPNPAIPPRPRIVVPGASPGPRYRPLK